GTVSEIEPLQTEALMTEASEQVDDLTGTPEKVTTTVAMDYGRITLDDDLVLYLFGTPGQERFWFMWDDLVRGAIGAVVLAAPSRTGTRAPSCPSERRTRSPPAGSYRHSPCSTRHCSTSAISS